MVGLQTLDLAIGVRVPASQPHRFKHLRAAQFSRRPFCLPSLPQSLFLSQEAQKLKGVLMLLELFVRLCG